MEINLPNNWTPREYQRPLWDYLKKGGREAVAVWHRRAGKDEIGLHRAACAAHRRVATYWHMLPEATQARKAIWDAINPVTGKRRIDEAFPKEIRETTREHEMFIKFRSGSTWQVVGSDNFNSLVGSPPAGIVYSEWSIANPSARAYLRPIIAENNGWELFIYTPRGRNHGLATYQAAKANPTSFAQVLTAQDTGVISNDRLLAERDAYIREYGQHEGEAYWRQEYFCDFNAANLGAIIARYVNDAEAQDRVNDQVVYDYDGAPLEISADIGFHDTAAFWFWQPMLAGFRLFDYDQDNGLNAEEWIERLKERIGDRPLGTIWLPHDARAKTFAAKFSVIEQFVRAFGTDKVKVVPLTGKSDRINAARSVISRCEFHETLCFKGLEALREWSYEWNDDLKTFSREPKHDWASHASDGFSYGAQIMRERVIKPKEGRPVFANPSVGYTPNQSDPVIGQVTFNQLVERQRRKMAEAE